MRRCLFFTFLLAAASFPIHISGQAPDMPIAQGDPGMGPNESGMQKAAKKKHILKDKITSDEFKLSDERTEKIYAIIKKHFDNHDNLNDDSVKASIFDEVGKVVPLTPAQKPDTRSLAAIKESLSQKVEEKYPKTPDQVRKDATDECDQKFAMVKPKEKVVVYFMRGNVSQRYEGTFYGFGGGSLRINSRYIPIFDLTPETRVKFDKKYNELARQEYIDTTVKNYISERLDFSEKLFAEEHRKLRQNNEKLGYIFQKRDWNTAQNIANEFLKEMQQEAKLRAEREAVEKAAKEKAKKEGPGNNPEGMPGEQPPANPENNNQQQGGGAPPPL